MDFGRILRELRGEKTQEEIAKAVGITKSSCSACCGKNDGITATGTAATEGRTVAVDPSVIPYGATIEIIYPDGSRAQYVAEDCGGAIKAQRLDVFFADHQAAQEFGVQTAYVFIIPEGGSGNE